MPAYSQSTIIMPPAGLGANDVSSEQVVVARARTGERQGGRDSPCRGGGLGVAGRHRLHAARADDRGVLLEQLGHPEARRQLHRRVVKAAQR